MPTSAAPASAASPRRKPARRSATRDMARDLTLESLHDQIATLSGTVAHLAGQLAAQNPMTPGRVELALDTVPILVPEADSPAGLALRSRMRRMVGIVTRSTRPG